MAASAAMTLARSTDGSNRVSTVNHAITPTVPAQRARCPRRRSTGATTASVSATFCPETALR